MCKDSNYYQITKIKLPKKNNLCWCLYFEEIEDKYGSGITSDFKKIKLKNNEYFVLGDNRENSMDSRYYGPFNKKNIKGSTNIIVFPFNKIGKVE